MRQEGFIKTSAGGLSARLLAAELAKTAMPCDRYLQGPIGRNGASSRESCCKEGMGEVLRVDTRAFWPLI